MKKKEKMKKEKSRWDQGNREEKGQTIAQDIKLLERMQGAAKRIGDSKVNSSCL